MLDWVLVPGCFIVIPLIAVALVGRSLMARRRLMRAARASTWGDLTKGALTIAHEGPLTTFWASGRAHRDSHRATAAATFVAIDEAALVAAEVRPWPRPPEITWLVRRGTQPVLAVQDSWLGPAIVEEGRGLMLEWRGATRADVVNVLRSLGWTVEDS